MDAGEFTDFWDTAKQLISDHYHKEDPEKAAAIKEFTGKDPVLVEGVCPVCPETWPEEDLPVIEFIDGSMIGPASKIEALKKEREEDK